jgi:hypothetical protein
VSLFYYYISGRNALTAKQLPGPLLPLADNVSMPFTGATLGPDQANGVIFAFQPRTAERCDARAQYWPDRQHWHNCGDYWIGYYHDAPPRPACLRRESFLESHPVLLEDGQTWDIPIARYLLGGSPLPASLSIDEQGHTIFRELPRYTAYSQAATKLLEILFTEPDGDPVKIPYDILEHLAVEALRLNYHVNREAILFRELLTTANLIALMKAALDLVTVESAQKKTSTPSGGAFDYGPLDGSQTITPQSAKSGSPSAKD